MVSRYVIDLGKDGRDITNDPLVQVLLNYAGGAKRLQNVGELVEYRLSVTALIYVVGAIFEAIITVSLLVMFREPSMKVRGRTHMHDTTHTDHDQPLTRYYHHH